MRLGPSSSLDGCQIAVLSGNGVRSNGHDGQQLDYYYHLWIGVDAVDIAVEYYSPILRDCGHKMTSLVCQKG